MTLKNEVNWLWIGIIIGLGVWIRPDALSLTGPAAFILLFRQQFWKDKGIHLLLLGAGILVLFIPYLGFNHLLSGSWMPNTFYAKQAEYASLLSQPWLVRFGQLATQPMIGSGALLVPGAIYAIYQMVMTRIHSSSNLISKKGIPMAAWFIWWVGYTCVYATILPVTYQHGRYLMPAMPVFFVIGLWGSLELLSEYWRKRKWSIPVKSWGFSILVVWAVFLFLGSATYSEDVAIIQSEMVGASQWISIHTAPDSVVAAHDIGALGYFGKRKIIDLAGLVTTNVIPIIRDENALKHYLDLHGADYLMTFPDWYTDLARDKKIIYQTTGQTVIQAGGTHMTVYYWKAGN